MINEIYLMQIKNLQVIIYHYAQEHDLFIKRIKGDLYEIIINDSSLNVVLIAVTSQK